MGKISKEEQARRDGFEYFVRLYRQQSVRIPEIDEEIARRNLTGKPIGIDKKTEQEYCQGVRMNTLDTVLIMVEWVLHEKLGFGRIRLNRFKAWFNDAADSLDRDYISWGDIRKALEEETGITTEINWFGQPVKNEELDPFA